MKLNWGMAIAIFYSCFVIAMVTMVIKSTQNKMDLVQENYYQHDLDYEEFRKKRQNNTELSEAVQIEYSIAQDRINLVFPETMKEADGLLKLFRPSDKSLDHAVPLKLDENAMMSIPVGTSLRSGLWRVQLDWKAQGKRFYKETSIVI